MAGFKKKQPQQAALKYAIYGPPGSGKTLTSLLMAEGLAKREKKRIAFVDTEFGSDFYAQDVKERLVHPAAFDFDALETRSLVDTLDSFLALDPAEHGVAVIDSVTHLWEAAKNAYEPADGSEIPKHMWSKIKKPYKDLMAFLLSSPMHVIICGREGNEYETDPATGEDRVVGKKLKGEGETNYEPHIVARLKPRREGDSFVHQAIIEKDRTGILTGKVIEWPTYSSLCEPLIHLLGDKQAQVESDQEVAARDASSLQQKEEEKNKISLGIKDEYCAKFILAKNLKELEKVSKLLTPQVKAKMVPKDVEALRSVYASRSAILTNGVPNV